MDIKIIRTLLLIYIMFITGTVTNIMGCEMKELLNNIYFKHIGLLLLIYFSLVLSKDKYDTFQNNILTTFKVWIFYIIFVRVNIVVNLVVIGLLLLLLTLINYKSHVETKQIEIDNEYHLYLDKSIIYLQNIIPIIMIIGFIFYVYKNKNNENLSIIKFLLGDFKC